MSSKIFVGLILEKGIDFSFGAKFRIIFASNSPVHNQENSSTNDQWIKFTFSLVPQNPQ
jgi:predicted TIM-barrel fold metal-dependent hydrolase